jgi:hypothetical protein
MNHNKYLGQKWWWTKLGITFLFKQWGGEKCTFKIFLGITPT